MTADFKRFTKSCASLFAGLTTGNFGYQWIHEDS